MGIVCYQLRKEKNMYLYLCAYTQTPSGIRHKQRIPALEWGELGRQGQEWEEHIFCVPLCFLLSELRPPANVFPTQNFKKHNLGVLIGKLWRV